MIINSSRCELGSGALVSFRKDQWLEEGRLYLMFPTLYSFAVYLTCSVHSQRSNGVWEVQLHPNLSQTATVELTALNQLLSDATPSFLHEDKRVSSVGSSQLNTSYFLQAAHLPRGNDKP